MMRTAPLLLITLERLFFSRFAPIIFIFCDHSVPDTVYINEKRVFCA